MAYIVGKTGFSSITELRRMLDIVVVVVVVVGCWDDHTAANQIK
jgi:hypothetical protein